MGYDDKAPIPALKGRVCDFESQIKMGLTELIPADAKRADQTLHLTAAGEAVDTSGA